eukprot:7219526-Pyramimonas_sp.AAC.1
MVDPSSAWSAEPPSGGAHTGGHGTSVGFGGGKGGGKGGKGGLPDEAAKPPLSAEEYLQLATLCEKLGDKVGAAAHR